MARTIPKDYLFSEEHEWIKIKDSDALMGISDHAQASLGDVVYVELPQVGQEIKQGRAIGVIESVKAVSDIYAPLSGQVKAVNKTVIDNPEKINQDPYGDGWLLLIEPAEMDEMKGLLSPGDYEEMLRRETKA